MLNALPDPAGLTELSPTSPDIVQAATMARIASLRHAARLLGVAELPSADESDHRPLARRHAIRAAREAGAGIESVLAAYAQQVEAGHDISAAALDTLAHEIEQSLASLDVLLSL